MPATFDTLIAKNKRKSALLMGGFIVFFLALGLLFGLVWSMSTSGGGGQQVTGYDRYGNPIYDQRPVATQRTDENGLDWHTALTVAGIAGGIAFFVAIWAMRSGGNALMRASGAHEIQKRDDPQLFNVVEELSLAAGIPMPKVYLINEQAMNAFATGSDPNNAAVAITVGLRQRLSRSQLQGVMAHELSHVRHYDIRFATLCAILVGGIALLAAVFRHSMWYMGGSRRRSDNDRGGNPIQMILLILAIVMAIIAPLLAMMVQMAISRQREYLADAGAVELTRDPDGMIGALAALTNDPNVLQAANKTTAPLYIVNPLHKLKSGTTGMFDTHPSLQDRIERLNTLKV